MKRAKLLLQNFPQSATDFVFFKDKKMFSVASSDNRQTTGAIRIQLFAFSSISTEYLHKI